MARPPSKHLFDLFASMDSHERGYVRKALSAPLGRKPAVSLALYDALAKATSSRDPILQDVATEFQVTNHFSQIKRNLYDQILRHLRTYHVQSSRRSQVMSLMEESGVLANKNLVEAGRERLEQAALLCKDAMLYGLEAEIYGIMVSLEKRVSTSTSESSIREMLERRNDAFRRGTIFTSLNILARKALESTQVLGSAGKELAARLLADPLHADDANYADFHHRFIYHNNRQMLLHVLGDVDRGYQEGKQLLALAKQQPNYKQEANSATIIGNLLVVQLWIGDMGSFLETLAEYDVLEPRSEYMEEEVYFNKVRGQMYHALYTRNVARARHLSEANLDAPAAYRQRGTTIRQTALCIATTCSLLDGDHGSARKYIAASMEEDHVEAFTRVSSRMQEILVLLAEGQYDVAHYSLRSFSRSLQPEQRNHGLLQAFLHYGRAVSIAKSESRRKKLKNEFEHAVQAGTYDQQDTLIAVTVGLKGVLL